jgi:hypothetical protein
LVKRVEVDVGSDGLGMVEACDMAVVKTWVEGRVDGGDGVEMKMVEQLEELLWGIWLEGGEAWDGKGEAQKRSGCVPS